MLNRIKSLIPLVILFVCFTFSFHKVNATHNRAGEITYKQINLYTYEFTLITYTYAPSAANEDRDSLTMDWGDGVLTDIPRVEIILLPDDIQKNVYIGTHTFPGIGVYQVVMSDPNRNADIVNIPNSVNVVFTVKTTLLIDPNLGFNNTPVLQNPPIDKAALGRLFIHNPSAYDIDGDSLSYEIAACLSENGNPILNYTYPKASDTLYVDPVTGDFIWDAPKGIGEYNVAIKINEWRNGVKIGSIVRDMQIEVEESDNTPPEISDPGDFCITAGDNLSFTVKASDPNGDNLTLSAYGGPLTLTESPAVFETRFGPSPLEGIFTWNTTCDHVRQQPYSVVFKALDNNPEVNLSAYSESKIKVVAPKPESLTATVSGNAVQLTWDNYICSNAQGFKIYRRNSPYDFQPEECETGIPAYTDYQMIANVPNINQTNYTDINLAPGYNYCYRIIAWFEDNAESYASEEVCVEVVQGTPIFLNASVEKTDSLNGKVYLRWMNPINFDVISYPGPYSYKLEAADELYGTNYQEIATTQGKEDTTYTETSVNTQKARSYRLTLYSNHTGTPQQVGNPAYTATVFAEGLPDNRKITIMAKENTPWTNTQYTIFRKNADENCTENSLPYDLINESSASTFTDYNLDNDKHYWYKIKTQGEYGLPDLPKNLINLSQEICISPQDTVPPCAVNLGLTSDCDLKNNYLTWSVDNSCSADIAEFRIYYSDSFENEFKLLKIIKDANARTYTHTPEGPQGACYAVSAVDSAGNYLSPDKLKRSCIDICHYYELPNVFTPNNDGINDYFIPFPYNYVDKIKLTVFDRWGVPVFETENPDINWNGTDMNSGKPVSDGTYYYICDVYEKRLTGIEVRNISGFLQVLANEKSNNEP